MAISIRKILGVALGFAGAMMPLHHAEARLSGVADVSYIRYDSTLNDKPNLEASSLEQHYSVLYDTNGVIVDGRLGRYKLAIGGEWAGYNTTITSHSNDPDPEVIKTKPQPRRARHFLWDAEVVIDPKELPFKFKAYTRDMKEITFERDTIAAISGNDPIIDPDIATNIYDGIHIRTGATLQIGVKNGMTNGFNTVFRDLPMILLDYRDEINRDWSDQTPVDNRLSRLAFVSLNKKDNWFHFRTTRYTDKINPTSSYNETQLQLGTVDQGLVRRWIDLTNWIKISVDGQFTKRRDYATNGPEEMFELNLFAMATRRMWEAKTYNYFSRTVDNSGPVYERRIPVFARGNVGLDTEWNLRTSYEDWQRVTADKEDRVTMQTAFRVDTFKRSPFTLGNTISVEKHNSEGANYISVDELIETTSTRRFSDRFFLAGSYNIKFFSNDTFRNEPDTVSADPNDFISTPSTESYVSQAFKGRGIYSPSQLLKSEIEVGYHRTDGNPQALSAQNGKDTTKSIGQTFSHEGSLVAYERYTLTSRTDWEPLARLKFNVTASGDVLQEKGVRTDYMTIVGGSVDYNLPKLSFRLDTRYTLRWGGEKGHGYMFEQLGRLQYNPDRSMDLSINSRFLRGKESGEKSEEDISISQVYNYYLYTSRGVARRLVEVNETAEISRSATERRKTLGVGLKYNPTKQLFISARARYSFLHQFSGFEREAIYGATIGMNFQKLQVALDYSYGRRDNEEKRIDKRFAVNVKKIF